jgi:hypothetical protein
MTTYYPMTKCYVVEYAVPGGGSLYLYLTADSEQDARTRVDPYFQPSGEENSISMVRLEIVSVSAMD